MSSILGKLDSYQLLTNLLPGAFFVFILKIFFETSFPTDNVMEDIVVYYFVGLVINRIGSLAIEPILKQVRFINHVPYSSFVKAERVNSKITTLSETNNYTRSLLTSAILFPIIWILQTLFIKWHWFSANWKALAAICLIVIFLFSYRKQSKYVCDRVEAVNSQSVKRRAKRGNHAFVVQTRRDCPEENAADRRSSR
ncbi:hypothetical protein [Clostridium sp. D33t1_170424_F3]|uniref:hypothetical protein n=1 Tax=Clostridium sp. D33t1_170424_F3 TaxID=2787099 RepID=UPI0018A90B42|nr:hypothetical protein [Clostridium sp. D33t1_170424_F3]